MMRKGGIPRLSRRIGATARPSQALVPRNFHAFPSARCVERDGTDTPRVRRLRARAVGASGPFAEQGGKTAVLLKRIRLQKSGRKLLHRINVRRVHPGGMRRAFPASKAEHPARGKRFGRFFGKLQRGDGRGERLRSASNLARSGKAPRPHLPAARRRPCRAFCRRRGENRL